MSNEGSVPWCIPPDSLVRTDEIAFGLWFTGLRFSGVFWFTRVVPVSCCGVEVQGVSGDPKELQKRFSSLYFFSISPVRYGNAATVTSDTNSFVRERGKKIERNHCF